MKLSTRLTSMQLLACVALLVLGIVGTACGGKSEWETAHEKEIMALAKDVREAVGQADAGRIDTSLFDPKFQPKREQKVADLGSSLQALIAGHELKDEVICKEVSAALSAADPYIHSAKEAQAKAEAETKQKLFAEQEAIRKKIVEEQESKERVMLANQQKKEEEEKLKNYVKEHPQESFKQYCQKIQRTCLEFSSKAEVSASAMLEPDMLAFSNVNKDEACIVFKAESVYSGSYAGIFKFMAVFKLDDDLKWKIIQVRGTNEDLIRKEEASERLIWLFKSMKEDYNAELMGTIKFK